MKSIIFIIPYFGHFNNYFEIWLNSCAHNPTVNWLIFTDCKDEYDYPENVKVVYTTFADIRARFQSFYDFPISLEKPFKFCDFRPAFGEIFYDYIKDYDFWGYCDTDLIWGDIRRFITEDLLADYRKIGFYGHCTLFRNDAVTNSIYKKQYSDLPDYKQVFSSSLAFCFDEYCVSEIFKRSEITAFRLGSCFDVRADYKCFLPATSHDEKDYDGILTAAFNYYRGRLVCYYESQKHKIIEKDVLYVHLQKRPMTVDCTSFDNFSIVPNSFVDDVGQWTYETIRQLAPRKLFYPHFIKWRTLYLIKKFFHKGYPRFYHYPKQASR